MARITLDTLVGVARLSAVVSIHLGFVAVLVAENALEHFEIRAVDVAVCAARPLGSMVARVDREPAGIMVEGCAQPAARGVARLASGWERGALVIRVGCSVVVSLVA